MLSTTTKRRASSIYVLAAGAAWVPLASAYSFTFQTTPQQCANLSIAISGNDGSPPYSVHMVPFGNSPLPNNVEARRIVDQQFSGDSTSVSFQLKYPANSQFVVVVSDSKGFGSGGTSAAATVTSSSDASCFDATQNVQPNFFYNVDPPNQIVQCFPSRLWWDPATVQGTPTFYGIIPGGQSFTIPQGDITTVPSEGQGFNWTASLRSGTTLLLGAGDNRGLGAGGSGLYIVSSGLNPSGSCLNDTSPSSTPGNPAGGAYPTSTSGASTGGSSTSNKSNTGAIAGGVVGGIVALLALVFLLLFFRRRKRFHQQQAMKERPDLFTDGEGPAEARDGDLSHLAAPEPYIVPSTGTMSDSGRTSEWVGSGNGYGVGAGLRPSFDERGRRISTVSGSSGTDALRPGTPLESSSGAGTSTWGGTSNTSRKSPAPPVMRPVNIIQHEDAGAPPEAGAEEPAESETVELPPAYTNLKNKPVT